MIVPDDIEKEEEVQEITGRHEMGMSEGSESKQSRTMHMSEDRTEVKSRLVGWSTTSIMVSCENNSAKGRGHEDKKAP